jgi:thiol-disulfide isomerase/thioredoxin
MALAIAALSLNTFAAEPAAKPRKTEPKGAEQPAPEAAELPPVELADSAKVKELLAAAKGKVVLLNFWATWCPPCVEETPHFVELYKKYKDKDFVFISLSADGPAAKDKAVTSFQKKHALPFPVYVLDGLDPDALKDVLGKELSGALPETLVYDKTGALKSSVEGGLSYDELEGMVKPLL